MSVCATNSVPARGQHFLPLLSKVPSPADEEDRTGYDAPQATRSLSIGTVLGALQASCLSSNSAWYLVLPIQASIGAVPEAPQASIN